MNYIKEHYTFKDDLLGQILAILIDQHFKGKATISGSYALNAYQSRNKRKFDPSGSFSFTPNEKEISSYGPHKLSESMSSFGPSFKPNNIDIFTYEKYKISESMSSFGPANYSPYALPHQIRFDINSQVMAHFYCQRALDSFYWDQDYGVDTSNTSCLLYKCYIHDKHSSFSDTLPWYFKIISVDELIVDPSKDVWGQYFDDLFDISICRISLTLHGPKDDRKFFFSLSKDVHKEVKAREFTFKITKGKDKKKGFARIKKYCNRGFSLKKCIFHHTYTEEDKLDYYLSFNEPL